MEMEIEMPDGGLSGPERRLWMGFPYGEHLDLRTGDAEQNDPARARSWDPKRHIEAKVIRDLLVGRRPVDQQQEKTEGAGSSPSVFISGAWITGQLDLRGINFEPPLLLQGCGFEQPLIITDSMSRSVRLYGCHLPGVQGAWLKCQGDLHLRDCQITGEVDLEGSYVGGQLVLSGPKSKLSNPGKVAIRANGLVVAGDMFCRDGAVVEGEIHLVAARIGGELRFTRSTLRNPGKIALNAARITVEKDMYCRMGFAAEGEVCLSGGHIKGQLNFNDAKLHQPGGVALRADHLVIDSHLYCQDDFEARGEVDLVATRVGGEIRFSKSKLSNPKGTALRAERMTVAGSMYCRAGLTVLGEINLRAVQIEGQLNFNDAKLDNKDGTALGADHLVIGGHLYCQDGFEAEGEVDLEAARIGGEVRFSKSTLSNPERIALQADRIFVGGNMYCRNGFDVEGCVSLRGAHIVGQLDFNDAKLRNADQLVLDAEKLVVGSHLYCQKGFDVTGKISLMSARVGGEVRFSGAKLSNPSGIALCADRLVVADDMYCREHLKIDGEVSLYGAQIKGSLSFSTTTVKNPRGMAIRAPHLIVGSDFSCDEGFTAEGLVDLTDAHVNGELSLSKARLSNRGDFALLASRLIIDKDMFCRDGFEADGTVCLVGAHILGKLSFTGAHLTGTKLFANRLSEAGISETLIADVLENKQETTKAPSKGGRFAKAWQALTSGVLRIAKADALRIVKVGVLRILRRDAKKAEGRPRALKIVYGKDGLALFADGLRVGIDMTCDVDFTAKGEIRLKGARIGQNLDFSDAEVNAEADAEDGIEADTEKKIANAINAEDMQANRMLMPAKCEHGRISLRNGKIVELDDKRGVEPDQIDIFGLSYDTLIPPLDAETRLKWLKKNDYDPQPYDQLARSYRQLGREDDARRVQLDQEQRKRDDLPPGGRKMWGYLQDWTIGYGYHASRAAALFGLVLLIGAVGFGIFPPPQMGTDRTLFNPIFYTLDMLVPFADFGQRDRWDSTFGHEVFKIILVIFGWTLAITAIAGINRKLRRS